MDPVSPVPAIAAVVVAFVTAFVLTRFFGAPPRRGRFLALDGLRGYLAFFVFLHHACIWQFFLRTGEWQLPPSNLYTHFGYGSVVLFFMITSFLFFSKLIDGRKKEIDWGRLFISRVLRLTPLYLVTMGLLFAIVAILSKGVLHEPIPRLLANMWNWLAFSIMDMPDINGVRNTSYIVSGVTWSLAYEWCFYVSLPLLAFTVGVVPPLPYILLSVVCVFGYTRLNLPFYHVLPFLGGVAAALLVRSERFCAFASGRVASLIVLGGLSIVINLFSTVREVIPILLLAIAFVLIACGNTLFGVLSNTAAAMLGEISYGVYLLQGIVLFVTFAFLMGFERAARLSTLTYWSLIVGLVPIFLCICFFVFRFIEYPAMQCTGRLTQFLRARGAALIGRAPAA